ncbi:hypothetical protein Nepgr_032436 [Nepenthes gracilis]|uniref:non-specific serine/threonine protein kinase n=1 Tax=Nepenthes gracilis TaxID=150966 RepID=A0AAD3TKF5_NEPGR|nr:hypothetical protein Nepgr_032436 [Nepenthes gracilis]
MASIPSSSPGGPPHSITNPPPPPRNSSAQPPQSSPPPESPPPPPPTPLLSPPPTATPPPIASPPPPPTASPPPSLTPPLIPPPPTSPAPPPASLVSSPPPTSRDSPPPASPPPPAEVISHSPPPPASFFPPPPAPSQPPPPSEQPLNSPPPPGDSSPPPPGNYLSIEGPNSSSASPVSTEQSTAKSTTTTNLTGNSTAPTSKIPNSDGVAIGVLAAVVVIGLVTIIVFLHRKRRKEGYNPYKLPSPYASSQNSGNNSGSDFGNSPSDPATIGNSKTWFTYEELSTATNGFSSKNILGAGGFGCVYRGVLADGMEVAVKKLKAGSGQGDREFRAEVEIISRVHHRHLVALVGYCIKEHQKLLVYEFVPNNTLHHHLHAAGRPVMDWALRVKVAAGSARGIAYLHEDCHPRIIHRDIKSPNILLDNNFEAKVSDFGLAKLAAELDANTHVSTRVMGTFGYMAPEYAASGKLTEKSDVFSFGVVLLELITGRKSVDESQPLGDESLVEWARPLLTQALETEEFEEVADPRLGGNYVRCEMLRMIEAAAACVRHSAAKRPRMTQVVRALDSMCEPSSDLLNGVRPGDSEIFDSREQSAEIRMFQRMAFESQE